MSFFQYFQYDFVRNALVAGVLISACAGLLGVPLVLRRFSFIGDGLSHAAFGALAVATVLRVSHTTALVMPATVLCALLILRGRSALLKGDAAIAAVSVSSLAVGYLVLNAFPSSSNIAGDVCGTLFGSSLILTLRPFDVRLCVCTSLLFIALYFAFYRRIFSVTFDADFARATGCNVAAVNSAFATMAAVVIVLAMNLVGSLLISALVVFPTISALRFFNSFRAVTVFACLESVACTVAGIALAIVCKTPVGPTIVVCDIAAFALCCAAGRAGR